jgi:hypothetical protein
MAWNCEACTFANSREHAFTCEICATVRSRHHSSPSSSPSSSSSLDCLPPSGAIPALEFKPFTSMPKSSSTASKPTTQTTLFGKKVVGNDDNDHDNPSSKPPRKRKAATSSSWETSSSSANNNNNVKISQYATVRSHIPYPELDAEAQRVLQDTFGLAKLRNLQPAAIRCALARKSQIIVMATGGGKSLCYQLPAMVLGGVTFVISPLIALMQDQVQALNAKGIPAAFVSSSQTETQNRGVLERLLGRPLVETIKRKNPPNNNNNNNNNNTSPPQPLPPLTLLYITPESIQTQRFRLVLGELYQQRRIAMFAIDEAHCISR